MIPRTYLTESIPACHRTKSTDATTVVLLAALVAAPLIVPQNLNAHQMTDYAGIVFPPDHALNTAIDSLPLYPNSDNFITSMSKTTALHPDFGTSWGDGGTDYQMGIPYNIVGAATTAVPITFIDYPEDSDPGPWPVPPNPLIETVFDWRQPDEGDRHLLVIDTSSHTLYEAWNFRGKSADSVWEASNGAKFDLNGYALRPETWTSADAAGLPIFPLLIRYDEVSRALAGDGVVHHAIRFTAATTQKAYLWPARHYASSSTDKNRPPMGLRVRLKASFDISNYSARMQVILRTMKKYGLIMSDNGSNWFFQGTHDDRWDDDEINTLKAIHGSDFEAVDISSWLSRPGFDPASGKVPPAPGAAVVVRHDNPMRNMMLTLRSGCAVNGRHPVAVTIETPQSGWVSVTIYDASGRCAARLYRGPLGVGRHTFTWNAPAAQRTGIRIVKVTGSDGTVLTGTLITTR